MVKKGDNFPLFEEGSLPPEAREELEGVIDSFFDRPIEKAEQFDWERFKQNEPFKAIMMPSELFWVLANFERSFTQKLGSQMYEKFAKAVAQAQEDVETAHQGYTISAPRVSPDQQAAIENILQSLEEGGDPDWEAELQSVLSTPGRPSIEISEQTWDIWIKYNDNRPPFCAEIKSPKPNKDQTIAAKRKMLLTAAVYSHRDEQVPTTRFAFPFNPYGSKEAYDHWPAKNIFDIENSSGVLVGEEFWTAVGGPGTMDGLCNFLLEESGGNVEKLEQLAGDGEL